MGKCDSSGIFLSIKGVFNLKIMQDPEIYLDSSNMIKAFEDSITEVMLKNSYNIEEQGGVTEQDIIKELIEEFAFDFEEVGITEFSLEQMNKFILHFQNNTPPIEKSTDEDAYDSELLTGRLDDLYDEDLFLLEAYQGSPKAKTHAETLINLILVKSFIFSENELGRKVPIRSQEELNDRITEILYQLLLDIIDYLTQVLNQETAQGTLKNKLIDEYNKNKNVPVKESTILEKLNIKKLCDASGKPDPKKMLRAFNMLQKYFPSLFKKPDNLDALVNNLRTINPRQSLVILLKFYNSWVILKNFDVIVTKKFGNLVEINENLPKFSKNRYKLKLEGSNLFTTWRTTDEIWLNKEINNVVQLLVTSLPKYKRDLISKKYELDPTKSLLFNEFSYAISKLKSIMKGSRHNDLTVEKFKENVLEEENSNISLKTKDFLKRHEITDFQLLLLLSRFTPEKAWQAIFEICSKLESSELNDICGIKSRKQKTSAQIIDKPFTDDDCAIYHTLYTELIGGPKSLFIDVLTGLSLYNYRGFITQAIDSIFETNYIQYYTDLNGEILIRMLKDMTSEKFKQGRERKINNNLASVVYPDFLEEFKIKTELVKYKEKVKRKGQEFELDKSRIYVLFTIGNLTIKYDTSRNTYEIISGELTGVDPSVVKKVLGFNIESQEFINGYNRINGTRIVNAQEIMDDPDGEMLNMVFKAIARTAVNNEFLRFEGGKPKILGKPLDSIKELKGKLTELSFGTKIGINKTIRGVVIVDTSDKFFVEMLGRIEEYIQGLSTSTIIISGDNTAVSANTLSRLGDAYPHLFYAQNSRKDSASNHFILLNNPAFLGLFQTKELKSSDSILEAEDMTEAEMITSNFINDFLGQLRAVEEPEEIHKNIIYIIPQVISDKKFIGRLGINLDAEVSVKEYPEIKKWSDIINSPNYSNIMMTIILHDMSLFFNNSKNAILEDFYKVFLEIPNIIYNEIDEGTWDEFIEKILDIIDIRKFYDLLSIKTKAKIIEFRERLKLDLPNTEFTPADIIKLYFFDNDTSEISNFIFRDLKYASEILAQILPPDISPLELIKKATKNYNNRHLADPVKLINQVHYISVNGNIVNNPLLDEMLKRFESIESTTLFFKERLLSTVSSMLDKGFAYTINIPEESGQDSLNTRVKNRLGDDWIDNNNEVVLMKITLPVKQGEKIVNTTFNIRNKDDVRALVNLFDKDKGVFKTSQLIYIEEFYSRIKDTYELTEDDYWDLYYSINEADEFKHNQLFLLILEQLYVNQEITKIPNIQELVQKYKDERPNRFIEKNGQTVFTDKDGNVLTDLDIIRKIIIAPVYKDASKLISAETNKKLRDRQKTLKLFILGYRKYEIENNVNELQIEINPSVEQYILLDYLFSEEWIISTVGHHLAHPNKKYKGGELTAEEIMMDEAIRKEAQNKRNVSITATMHEFELDLLDGIPSYYNVAIIEDPFDLLSNAQGLIEEVDPYNGATFVNPFTVHLENRSLKGSQAGIVKKQFVHYYDHRTGTGGIIKTAGFGCTNMLMRDSKGWRNLMKSMTYRRWRITSPNVKNYSLNEYVSAEDANILNPFSKMEIPVIYFKGEDGNLYAREILSYKGDYNYFVKEYQVSEENGLRIKGSDIYYKTIDKVHNNYALWNLFGGYNSYELDSETGELVPSEKSIELVVEVMNHVGIQLNDEIETQEDVYQFMKHSDIQYAATTEAVKQGAGNINRKEAFTSGEELDFIKVFMGQAGIQLDKEHSADGEDVSLMTQVVSACISRGYTPELATDMYNALASLARTSLRKELEAFEKYINGEDLESFDKLITEKYIDSLLHDTNPNLLATELAADLINKMKLGKEIDESANIPFSDPAIYNQFVTKLAVAFTNAAIKIKIDGVLSMLCPSWGLFKIYGNKLLHEYNSDYELELELSMYDTDPKYSLNVSDILIGRYYKLHHYNKPPEIVFILTPKDYFNLKLRLNTVGVENIVRINEYIVNGRDLGHYNCIFTAEDDSDLTIVKGKSNQFNIYDLDSVKALFEARERNASKEELITLTENLQRDLLAINNLETVYINGIRKTVTKLNKIIPYEVILPKYFQTSFGLSLHDNLSEIDVDFFIRKQVETITPKLPDEAYDVCLKRADGNHIYIKYRSKPRGDNLSEKEFIKKRSKGRVIRLKNKKNKEELYELESEDDKILQYQNEFGKAYEVIETDNIDFYLELFKDIIGISFASDSLYLTELELGGHDWIKSIHDNIDVMREFMDDWTLSGLSLREYNEFTKVTVQNEQLLNRFRRRAERMYASFLKALELVAARIPALSMLSFMPMKIAGFDNSGTNTAYVSTSLIWLQGSDFDIDTATFTRYDTGRNGLFIHWSEKANLSSYELLKACDSLPFPTGEQTKEFIEYPDYRLSIDLMRSNCPIIKIKNKFELDLSTPEKILEFARIIRFVNEYGISMLILTEFDQEYPLSQEIHDLLKTEIDIHNMSLENMTEKYRISAIKNFLLTKMYDVIANPSNLILAQIPIDDATKVVKEPLKDPSLRDAVIAKEAIPGDPTVKVTGIYKNQVGKKGVGICATALKSYFATFLHNTSVLNNLKSNKEELKRLILGKKGIKIKDRTYFGLVNLYLKNGISISEDQAIDIINRLDNPDNNVTTEEIRQVILHVANSGIDGAILLSAMLSQATDNAKEGSLGKLNAGTKTLGMYMFGIILGMSFEDLSSIMMSESARVLSELTEGNAFNLEFAENRIPDAINYIDGNFSTKLRDFPNDSIKSRALKKVIKRIYHDLYINIEEGDTKESILKKESAFETNFEKYWDDAKEKSGSSNIKTLFSWTLKNLLNTKNGKLIPYIASRYYLNPKLVYGEKAIENDKLTRKAWKVAFEYSYQSKVVEDDKDNFIALRILSKGAEELSLLGRLLKLNQGLPSKPDDVLKFISNFESIITKDDIKKFKKENKIDNIPPFTLANFVNNPDIYILIYENKKSAINILDVLKNAPHFFEYLLTLRLFDEGIKKKSAKYRIMRDLIVEAENKLNIKSEDEKQKLGKRLRLMMDDYIMTDFFINFKSTEDSNPGLFFTINPGLLYYDLNGKIHVSDSVMRISLGTLSGQSSFKLWMELTVIPNLQEGNNGNEYNIILAMNRFIKDLGANGFNKTPNHVDTTGYTLPINMSPRSDEERDTFNEYLSQFNLLTKQIGDSNEHTKYYSGGTSYRIADLLFLYNLIVYKNLQGEATLKNIFNLSTQFGLIKKFYDYEAKFDRESNLTAESIPASYWRLWATPVGSIFGAYGPLIFASDKDEFTLSLFILEQPQRNDNSDPNGYNPDDDDNIEVQKNINKSGKEYVKAGTDVFSIPNLNFTSFSSEIRLNIKIDGKEYRVIINHNKLIAFIDSEKNIYYFDKSEDIGVTITSNKGVNFGQNISQVLILIQNKLNPCK